jgi:hypothetical protein
VLTELYQRCDERTGKIAAFADAAHAAGQRCQRDYDTAREAMTPPRSTASPVALPPEGAAAALGAAQRRLIAGE